MLEGLADEIHPDEYAGCYYPRYIGRDPSNGLSLHSWGIAVDLNVPGNLRGTVGEMDRRVVAIFKKWGFAWGGDWNYTDPMHFEMDKVVRARLSRRAGRARHTRRHALGPGHLARRSLLGLGDGGRPSR